MSPRVYILAAMVAAFSGLDEPASPVAPPGFRMAVEARGLLDARSLHSGADGALLVDSVEAGFGYEIRPARPGEPVAVIEVATTLSGSPHRLEATAALEPGLLHWDAALAQVTLPAMKPMAGNRSKVWVTDSPHHSAVLADDGSVFVLDSRAGVVYRLTPL